MAPLKPTFTDVHGRKIAAQMIHEGRTARLTINELDDNGEPTTILVLNSYDATLLARACNLFVKHNFSVNFTDVNMMLSPEDKAQILGDDEELPQDKDTW
ncbi:hypothetical protein ACFSSC_08235 [Corynebacterium mendelii]|uniref:Uncharacterized protein n=1 Tax=Corynebacterium mendelii TaxID=2765362 RepID=A0A939IY25_9CORY|nr:hypothetical protein [Corynebacterium mendelii]MBN9644678.1 hypothetical protein [Corynebacterium mendelii]